MYLLAQHYWEEFLAIPEIIRLDYAKGQGRFEPTLLIKANTLLLKHIVQGVRMQLVFSRLSNHLLYALKVEDDETKPVILWSILEHDEEKDALVAILQGKSCRIILFNELTVNVAWRSQSIIVHKDLAKMLTGVNTHSVNYGELRAEALNILDKSHNNEITKEGIIVINLLNTTSWNSLFNQFITSHATGSLVRLFDSDEGSQQEQLVIWLTDSLNPLGVYHSPQIPKGNGFRELTDVLLSYQYGSILIESKTLSIFGRDRLPDRSKLARDMSGHIKKALKQLQGGIRRLKGGTPVISKTGAQLDVERTYPFHGIIIVPDLELVQDHDAYGLELIGEFVKKTGSYLHLLDVAELLRIVQAAEMASTRSTSVTPMMAFDHYLIERANKAQEAGTLCIKILHQFTDE